MKKFLVLIAALLLTLSFTFGAAFAEEVVPTPYEETEPVVALSTEDFVKELCDLNTANNKEQVRTFLTGQLKAALGEVSDDSVVPRYFSKDECSGYNIEAKIDVASTDKCIIIGAHYDAIGEGANDNVCGVAAMLEIAKNLYARKNKLRFDVYFVAFDCEESGMIGSECYVANQRRVELDKIVVMFNIDTIAAGENLYLMCENQPTDLAKFMLSKSNALVEKPYAAGIYDFDGFGYGYYEFVQGTDYTPFRVRGVPSVSLFAGKYGLLGYYDDSGVTNTNADTLENLVKTNPNYLQRITEVSSVITNTVLDEDFFAVANNARSQLVNNGLWYNHWWPALIVLGVLVILAILTLLYSRKLQKKAILGTAEVNNKKLFDKPKEEDIFTFDKGNSQGATPKDEPQKDDVDEIFTFKK